jgi:hypothetical protein
MGCWNSTCAVSNLHIKAGQKVAVFLLVASEFEPNYCYTNSVYNPCIFPFYGEYDDYGGVENTHGVAHDMIIEAMRSQLHEMDLGRNQYHDIAVKKENFDAAMLFEADHENRLFIARKERSGDIEDMITILQHRIQTTEEGALKETLKEALEDSQAELAKVKVKPARQVKHVQIHGDIFDDILNNFTVEDYTRDEVTGKYSHHHLRYADVAALLPALVREMRDYQQKTGRAGIRMSIMDDENKPVGWRLLSLLEQMGMTDWGVILTVDDVVRHLFEANATDDEFIAYLGEALKGAWINIFMARTRKIWQVPCGSGSQSDETNGYELLIASMQKIINQEKAERAEWEKEMNLDSE